MSNIEQTEARNTVSSNQSDQFSQSNRIDQSCEVKPTETSDQVEIIETIGQNAPIQICQIPQNSAMMPPGSGRELVWVFAIAYVFTATGGMCKGLAELIDTIHGNKSDRDS